MTEATAHIRIKQSQQRRGNQFYKPSALASDYATLCGAAPTGEDFSYGDAASYIRKGQTEWTHDRCGTPKYELVDGKIEMVDEPISTHITLCPACAAKRCPAG